MALSVYIYVRVYRQQNSTGVTLSQSECSALLDHNTIYVIVLGLTEEKSYSYHYRVYISVTFSQHIRFHWVGFNDRNCIRTYASLYPLPRSFLLQSTLHISMQNELATHEVLSGDSSSYCQQWTIVLVMYTSHHQGRQVIKRNNSKP